MYSDNGIFDFKLLEQILQFPDERYFTKFTKNTGNLNEIKKYWILAQQEINKDKKLRFFKTHHLNCKIDNYNFTDRNNTLGTIYIVRDPRNVITSLMNHFLINEEDALKMMSNVHRNLRDRNDKDNYATYSFISSWDKNYKSWKLTKNINKILIKYEDLENNIENTFLKIIKFTNKVMRKNDEIDFRIAQRISYGHYHG